VPHHRYKKRLTHSGYITYKTWTKSIITLNEKNSNSTEAAGISYTQCNSGNPTAALCSVQAFTLINYLHLILLDDKYILHI